MAPTALSDPGAVRLERQTSSHRVSPERHDALMKIVINALSARLGGGQTYVKNLLAHLPERDDLEIQVFAPPSLTLPTDSRIVRRTARWPTENPILRTLWEVIALPRVLAREERSGAVLSRRCCCHSGAKWMQDRNHVQKHDSV